MQPKERARGPLPSVAFPRGRGCGRGRGHGGQQGWTQPRAPSTSLPEAPRTPCPPPCPPHLLASFRCLLLCSAGFQENSFRNQVDGQALGPAWLLAIHTAIPDRAGCPSWTVPALSTVEKGLIPEASGTGQEQPRWAVGASSAPAHTYPALSPALESKHGQGRGPAHKARSQTCLPFHRPLSVAPVTRAQS